MPSVTPAYWADVFRRGADYSEQFVLREGGVAGTLVDLTGAVVTITVRPRIGTAVVYVTTDVSPKVTHNGAGGTITFVLAEADTLAYPHGGHEFELKVTLGNGTTNVYIVGTLSVEG